MKSKGTLVGMILNIVEFSGEILLLLANYYALRNLHPGQ